MTKYEIMYEALQEKVNSGELTVEDAEILNDIAYDRYAEDMTEYTESCDEGMTYEEYLESMEDDLFGESTRLGREIHKKAEEFSNNREEYYRLMMKAKEDMKKSQETGNKKRADIMKKYYDKYSKLYNDGYKSQEMDTLDKALKKKIYTWF